MNRGRRTSRALLTAVVLAGLVVGMPVTAYAAEQQYTIVADHLGNQRLPADPAADFASPPVAGGRVTSDIDGTACDSTYGVQLVRDRPYLPDAVVHRFDDGRACDPPVTQSGVSWDEGTYHFDARVTTRQESAFSYGFVRADW